MMTAATVNKYPPLTFYPQPILQTDAIFDPMTHARCPVTGYNHLRMHQNRQRNPVQRRRRSQVIPRAAASQRKRPASIRPETNQSSPGSTRTNGLPECLGSRFQTEGLGGQGKAGERAGWDRGLPLTRSCRPPESKGRKQARTGSWV